MEGPIDRFDSTSTWDLNRGASRELDTTTYGKTTMKVVADGGNTAVRSVGRDPYNLRGKTGGVLTVHIPDPSKVREIMLYIAKDVSFGSFGTYVWRGNSFVKGRNELYFSLQTDLDEVEGDWNGQQEFSAMQVLLAPQADQAAEIYCESIEFITSSVGNVVFTMDDQWSSQYTEAYPILKQYGMKGNIAVISSEVGSVDKMTTEQLKEVYDNGWDLMIHTHTHPNLGTLAKEEQRNEIRQCKQWLESNGFVGATDMVVYPYGGYNDDTIAVMNEEGIKWSRSLVDGVDANPSPNPQQIHTINLITNTPTEYAKKAIDRAIATGTTVVFLNHRYKDGMDDGIGMYYGTTEFEEIVKYAADKKKQKKVNVVTVSQLLDNFY